MTDDRIPRIQLLLDLGRAPEAIELSGRLAAEQPEDWRSHYWLARSHLANKQRGAAETSCVRALALAPDEVDVAQLAVRTVLALPRTKQNVELIWGRARRLAELSAGDAYSAYLIAYAAAMVGRHQDALAWKDRCAALDPAGSLPLYAAAEVELRFLERKSGRHVATEAEAAIQELLRRDPLDEHAHSLQARAMKVKASVIGRAAAEDQIAIAAQLVRGGERPPAEVFRALASRAIGPVAPVMFWVALTIAGIVFVRSADWKWWIAVPATALWFGSRELTRRRVARVVSVLPPGGIRRVLISIGATMMAAGAVVMAAAVGFLIHWTPITTEHAVALGYGDLPARTISVVTYRSQQPIPAVPGPSGPLMPAISLPPVPEVRLVVRRPAPDETIAIELLRFLAAMGAASLVVGAVTGSDGWRLRRNAQPGHRH